MAIEQEIKMLVPDNLVFDLEQVDWLAQMTVSGPEEKHLVSTYYDTPNFALQEFGVGLRLRQINDQWLQTVKCSGQAVEGLHQRKEWEHELNDGNFDLNLLKQTELAPLLENTEVWPKLFDIFTTDFIRKQWLLSPDNETLIELAYDTGKVITGSKQARIHEIELELKSGDLQKMLSISQKLKTELSLDYSDVSKAAQGYRLFLTC